jgi:hypothetical protein
MYRFFRRQGKVKLGVNQQIVLSGRFSSIVLAVELPVELP